MFDYRLFFPNIAVEDQRRSTQRVPFALGADKRVRRLPMTRGEARAAGRP
jgi:hypothetical protein